MCAHGPPVNGMTHHLAGRILRRKAEGFNRLGHAHPARGDWGQKTYPLCVGHEILGDVVAVGESVTKFKVCGVSV